MTIMATHFAIVLGAWRLRVRIDLDEPRESEHAEAAPEAPSRAARTGNDGWSAPPWSEPRFSPRGGTYQG
jgi:hypothetical protein